MKIQSPKKATQVKRAIAAAAITGAIGFGLGGGGNALAADCREADTRDAWCEESYPMPTDPDSPASTAVSSLRGLARIRIPLAATKLSQLT